MRPLAWTAALAGIGALGACATRAPQPLPTYDFGPQSALCAEAKASKQWVASCESGFMPPLADPDAVRSYRMVIAPTGYELAVPVSLRIDVHADGSGEIYWSPKRPSGPPPRPPKGAFLVRSSPERLRPPAPLTAAEVTEFERAFVAAGYGSMLRFGAGGACLDGEEHVLEWSAAADYHALVREGCQSDLPWGLFYNLAVAKGLADQPTK